MLPAHAERRLRIADRRVQIFPDARDADRVIDPLPNILRARRETNPSIAYALVAPVVPVGCYPASS